MLETKIEKLIHAVGKRIGPRSVKQAIWDREHAQGQWDWTRDTTRESRPRDIAYEVLDRHSPGADILDLGCGDGYSARMIAGHFHEYFGIDISAVAVETARRRLADDPERAQKSHFEASDILTYVPPKKFSIILFSDCLPYFALPQVKRILRRYSGFLGTEGIFVVRLYDREKYRYIAEHIESAYRVTERVVRDDSAGVVLAFLPGQ
jgi:SAM-dependent methyltransferase